MSDPHPAHAFDAYPADRYLKTRVPDAWDMIDFLKGYDSEPDAIQLRHSWKEALQRVAAATESSDDRKERAEYLLGIYENIDKKRFRDWRSNLQPDSPSISITNSKKFSVSVNVPGKGSDGRSGRGKGRGRGKKTKRTNLDKDEDGELARAKRTKSNRSDESAIKRLNHFKQRLVNIDDASKWYLDGDRPSVEDRLAEYVYNHNEKETPAHSFVLNTGDSEVEKLFGKEEWVEIKGRFPQSPGPDTILKAYLDLFLNKKTVDDIYDILERGAYFTVDETLDGPTRREKYQNLQWAHLVLQWVIHDYKSGHIALADNREKWYQGHVWAALFDRGLETIPDVRVISGECPTSATSFRKNPTDAPRGTRKTSGCYHDAVIKFTQLELGGVENGREYTIPTAPKWTGDTMKLVKMSRDMLVHLFSRFGGEIRKLPVVGVVTGALHFQTHLTVYGGGSVCILRGSRIFELPTRVQHFGPFAAAMLHVWEIITIMRQCTEALTVLQSTLDFDDGLQAPSAGLLGSIETDPPTDGDAETDEEQCDGVGDCVQ